MIGNPEAAIVTYLEEGWSGEGWSPYEMLIVGEFALATAPIADPAASAAEFRRLVLAEARRRWIDGYFANPFTTGPKRRPHGSTI